MKFDSRDKKIFRELYHNNRIPLSELARTCHLSRELVRSRVARLEREGTIKQYLTIFNYAAFGYSFFGFLFLRSNKYAQTASYFKSQPSCIQFGRMYGEYDYYVTVVFKSRKEAEQFVLALQTDTKSGVSECQLVEPVVSELYPLKSCDDNSPERYQLSEDSSAQSLDAVDKIMLDLLRDNARTSIVDLARATEMSAEAALYRYRQLIKRKIILGTRFAVGVTAAQLHYTQVWLDLTEYSSKTLTKLRTISRTHPKVNSLVFSVSPAICFVQLLHESYDDVKQAVKEITVALGPLLRGCSMTFVEEEEYLNTLPFLDELAIKR